MEENVPAKRSMMPVVIGALAVLLALGGVAYVASQRSAGNETAQTSQEAPTAAEEQTEPSAAEEVESESTGEVKEITISNQGMKFTMNGIRVKKGDTVRLTYTNSGGFHDWVVDEFDAKTDQIQAGQSDTVEFVADQAGTFEYYCSVGNHREMGMKGNLIVEE